VRAFLVPQSREALQLLASRPSGGGSSRLAAQKVIKTALDPTNWRLMTAGLSYRLGYLSGSLKGYEWEEDLMEIVK